MRNRLSFLLLGVALLSIAGVWFTYSTVEAKSRPRTLSFDVAEDMSRFVMDEDPVFEEDGYPAHGNSFVTVGYIYPAGTLNGTNGTNPDGSPEFPDKVIGEWTCRGYFIHDGAHATEGVWVVTTQTYSFGEEYGRDMVVTDGYEWAEIGRVGYRPVTGGTGQYRGVTGQAEQVMLGFNASEGVNLSFSLELSR